ncbi:MAG: discoidin domain-containing protein, partial [Oscillospiraceae bacterium]|nr:discoidin domain-containing protein [Oscillospiraceae bacterium]
AINGNAGDFWLTKNAETNPEKRYITIVLDEPAFLSALQYVPRQNGTSGMIRSAKIQVSMDNANWTTVVASTNWEENAEAKYVAFEKPVKAKYVRVIGMETSDGYMSAALINLFEDTTAKIPPTATLSYSTTTLTNQDVTVTLYPDKCVEIADEAVTKQADGSFTYTFTTNGSYTFVFEDAFGNIGRETATVNWIDKEPPKATVVYSTLDETAGSVVATLKNLNSDDPITITNNGGSDTYTFTKNGSFLFTYEDAAGNKAETKAVVTWIVEEAPHILLEFSEEKLTNQPVTVTVVGDAEFVITSNDRQKSHVFYENGEWTFEYRTTVGFTGSITARVTWIDTEAPKGSIAYSTKELTNQPVRATLLVDEEIIIDRAEGVERDESGNYYHTFTENGSFRFEYHDLAGNKGAQTATVSWMDTTPAEVTITYSKTTLTNETVMATLSSEEEITITNNNGSNLYLFDKNGTFEFVYVDRAGNVGKALAEVTWIDKQAPIGNIQYSTTETVAGPVVATLVCDEESIIVLNNDGKTTYTFYENGGFQFVYQDEAGNIGTTYAEVTWILDTDVRIEYSTTDPTNGNVTATVIPDEREIKITNNDGKFSYTFTENGTFTFAYVDQSGKKETITAEVTWIDKELPTFEVRYDYADPKDPNYVTNQSVTATLISSEEILIVNDSSSTTYGSVFTYLFDENAAVTLLYHDRAGNAGTYVLKVDWIDKEPPVGTLTYSKQQKPTDPVTVTLTANEEIIIDNNGGSNEFTFLYNGIFEFIFHDKAGNTGSALAEVTWIDDEPEVDNPPIILIEKDEFFFDISTDMQVDLAYFKSLITIIDDRDEIDINDTSKVTITSGLEWMTGEYVITVTVKDSGGNIAVLQIKVNIIDSSVDFTSLSFEIADGPFVYNGNPHLPAVTVRNGVEVLTSMTDYTASYTNNVNAGEATVLVNGLGRYKGFVTLSFTIQKAQPNPDVYPDASVVVSYDIEKVGSVSLPDGWIWLDPDASLKVGDTVAKAVYLTDDNYESLEVEITVTRLEQILPNQPPVITIESKEWIFDRRTSSGMDLVSYLKRFIKITDDRDGSIDVNTSEQVVMTIEPDFAWEVGIYTVTVTATDSAGASSRETMTVEVIDSTVYLEQLTVELEEGTFVYNGSPQLPSVTVKHGDVVLTEKEHYEVLYENNIDAGEATVTVTGLGLYSGTRTLTFSIQKAQPVAPELSMNVPYDVEKAGEIALPEGWSWADPEAVLKTGENVLEAVYEGDQNHEAMKVTIVVTKEAPAPTPDVTAPVISVEKDRYTFDVRTDAPIDLDDIKSLFTVTDDVDEDIHHRVQITVVPEFKWEVGTYVVTVTATDLAGNVAEKQITIQIVDSTVDFADVTIEMDGAGFVYDGSAHTPALIVKYGDVLLEAGRDYEVFYENNSNAGTATVTVRGLAPYVGTKVLYFEIAKAPQPEIVPDSAVKAGAEAKYAKDIELPEGWRWENPDAA